MKRVVVDFDENGMASVKTEGFKGKSCTAEVDKILQGARSFGLETKTESLTPTQEYYAKEETSVRTGA